MQVSRRDFFNVVTEGAKASALLGLGFSPELQSRLSIEVGIQNALNRSSETGEKVVVDLEEGETVFLDTIKLDAKPNSNIVIRGPERRATLRLDEWRAENIPVDKWKGNGSNLMRIKMGEQSQISFQNIDFHGGLSDEANRRHYAPLSPFDGIIAAVGNGNIYSLEGNQQGSLSFENCGFESSIAAAVTPVGLENVSFNNCHGEFADALVALT